MLQRIKIASNANSCVLSAPEMLDQGGEFWNFFASGVTDVQDGDAEAAILIIWCDWIPIFAIPHFLFGEAFHLIGAGLF